jgi:hypothetical protein
MAHIITHPAGSYEEIANDDSQRAALTIHVGTSSWGNLTPDQRKVLVQLVERYAQQIYVHLQLLGDAHAKVGATLGTSASGVRQLQAQPRPDEEVAGDAD